MSDFVMFAHVRYSKLNFLHVDITQHCLHQDFFLFFFDTLNAVFIFYVRAICSLGYIYGFRYPSFFYSKSYKVPGLSEGQPSLPYASPSKMRKWATIL
jgi:hypothetical protein